jgi:hypothetical protein
MRRRARGETAGEGEYAEGDSGRIVPFSGGVLYNVGGKNVHVARGFA